MSTETTTPAIDRAAEAIVRAEDILDWDVLGESLRDYPRDLARAALAAALDVEEMARVAQAHDQETGQTIRAWDDVPEWSRESYRDDARAIRAAILGEEN